MAGDVYVTFGGDTAALEASLASAKSAVTSFARELSTLAREQVATGASADSELGQKMLAVAGQLSLAKASVTGLKTELGGLGQRAGEGGAELEGHFAQVREMLMGLTSPLRAVRENLGEVAEAFLAAFAVEKVAEFVKSMGELGEQTERTGAILGLTSEQVGELQYALQATGSDSQDLDRVMGRFEASLAAVKTGQEPVAAGLRAIGLSAKDLIGVPLPQQLEKIAAATSRFADGTNKTAALQAMGRGFVELIPLLDKGSEGLETLRQTADATNSVLNETTTSGLVGMQHAIVDLGTSIKGDLIQAFTAFVPAVDGAVQIMTDLAQAMSNSIKNGGSFGQALSLAAGALQVVESAIVLAIQSLKDFDATGGAAINAVNQYFMGLGTTTRDIFQALGAGILGFFTALVAAGAEAVHAVEQQFIDLGTVIGDTLKLNFGGAKEAFGSMGSDAAASAAKISGAFSAAVDFSKAEADSHAANAAVAASFRNMNATILANANTAKAEYAKIWGLGGEETPKAPPTQQVPALQEGRSSAAKDAQAETAQEVDLYKSAAQQKEGVLNEELKTHAVTMQQWLTQTIDALQDEANDVKDAYDRELQTVGLTSEQIIAIKTKEQQALAEIAQKMNQAESKAAEQSAQQWQNAMKSINSAFDSQINGLLKGTTNWHTAFLNVLRDLTEQVIKFFVNWGLQQAENVAKSILLGNTQVAAHVAGDTTMAAADQSASGVGLIGFAETAMKSIEAFAGQVAAGVAAFMAPIVGPAAPGVGAAAGAAVMGFGGIGAMDIGAYDIPQDQLALIHKNELVMPSAQASAFRNMLENGGASGGRGDGATHNHTWNVDARKVNDPDGVVDAIRARAKDVGRALAMNPRFRQR